MSEMREMPNTKIVVIDDERSVQEVVSAYLQKDGFTVFVAGSGSEGCRSRSDAGRH